MVINVEIMSGAGNLFSVIDNRELNLNREKAKNLAPIVCRKAYNNTMDTDGLLLITQGREEYKVNVDFYNPDGSTSMMCGNGARCAILYASNYGLISEGNNDLISFKMAGNIYKAQINANNIKIYFPPPLEISLDLMFTVSYGKVFADYVNVNSDHLLIYKNDFEKFFGLGLEQINLNMFAPDLRNHSSLPNGANVDVYSIENRIIHLRTYERGVEAETSACGTGAISVALIGAIKHNLRFPIEIIPKSKKKLVVDIIGDIDQFIEAIILEGDAEFVGNFLYDIKQ